MAFSGRCLLVSVSPMTSYWIFLACIIKSSMEASDASVRALKYASHGGKIEDPFGENGRCDNVTKDTHSLTSCLSQMGVGMGVGIKSLQSEVDYAENLCSQQHSQTDRKATLLAV
ncbi:hypothetical protein ANCDUO_23549 [Ancylostoma duodenale]|uniref:Uncharacterized protein n=1 Tax=Ancylostoma duodenale TaxID=51022 RepID=A0A0C2FD03_9BILA|nr:hypothetical protein ANCDUO_23549 [Ancylostoma duodenale]